jgi:hypothetical protein
MLRARARLRWASPMLLVLLVSGAAPVEAPRVWGKRPPNPRSLVGEHLEFRLKWQGIPAADATLEVVDGGDGRIVFRATATTIGVADLLYPVRSKIESTALLSGLRVERYVQDGKEGRGRAELMEIVFDLDRGVAQRTEDGEPLEPVEVPVDVQDPLSSFYAFRTRDPDDEGVVELTISDGKRTKAGKVRIVGRESIKTPAGQFDTVIISPDIEGLGGIFKKSPGATLFIWLTDDEWRRPVKMRSKVSVGSFTAVLRKWEHAAADRSAAQQIQAFPASP